MEGFVGREWLLDTVAGWLDEGDEPYLLLTADPGWGKSALAAWLAGAGPAPADAGAAATLASLRARWDAVHFCVFRGQQGTVEPAAFATSLSNQLGRRIDGFARAALERVDRPIEVTQNVIENVGTVIGAQVTNVAPTAQDVYHRSVREPLQDLARTRPKLSVAILVDALDEAVLQEGTTIVDLIAGSGDLPAGVRWVLTTRREPSVLNRFDGAKSVKLWRDHQSAARGDVRSYVADRLPTIDTKVRKRLERQAGTNFLYAKWVLDEVAGGQRSATELAGLPHGLYGLYREFLDRLMPSDKQGFTATWLGRHEPLFSCLSVATPAAPRASLPSWLGWPRAELTAALREITQLTEPFADGYRFYHRSVVDFLRADQYDEDDEQVDNDYYVDPLRAHARIASHYLRAAGDWGRSDAYGLRELVGHLYALTDPGPHGSGIGIGDLYTVALDPAFHRAQRAELGGVHATLDDLRTTLRAALAHGGAEDLVQALRCVAAFRRITRGGELSRAVFDALEIGNIDLAFEKTTHYGLETMSGAWRRVLQLYLAWEAAEAGKVDRAREAVADATAVWSSELGELTDALLVRTALELGRQERTPRAWLTDFGRANDAQILLKTYSPVTDLSGDEVRRVAEQVEPRVRDLEMLTEAGRAEAVSARAFIEHQVDPETSAEIASSLQHGLRRIAAYDTGKQLIMRALVPVLENPYPRYRDIAMEAVGVALLGVTDVRFVRALFKSLLRAGLDDEGVTFTFDLPAVVLAECDARGRTAPELESYLWMARERRDVWGTSVRALSAQAAATFHRGDTEQVWSVLREAAATPIGYAGYGTIALLEVIDRCHEFGMPAEAEAAEWGPSSLRSLPDLARACAAEVYDCDIRKQREALVELHTTWAQAAAPDAGAARQTLSSIDDPDVRRAYLSHVCARSADTARALVPAALFDSTALDTLLARVVVASVATFSDDELQAVADLTAGEFTSGRPWELGQWR